MSESKEMAYKVSLKTGDRVKVVLLREPKIGHRNIAAQSAASGSGDNQFVFALNMHAEMLRLLIISIDGKPVGAKELLSMDDHFTTKEYKKLEKVMKQLNGDDEEDMKGPLGLPIELVPIGNI